MHTYDTAPVWKSDTLQESIVSSHHMGSRGQTLVIGFGSKSFDLLSHLDSSTHLILETGAVTESD